MAVPRNRSSNARKKSRRAHHALKERNIGICKCGHHILPHRMCNACGLYKDRVYKNVSE